VIFGIVETSANATLDQTSRFTAAANQVFLNVPETEFTFLITFATSGFGGMVDQTLG
jgi:multidrug efflux pump